MKTPNKTPLAKVINDALESITELPWFEVFHTGTHTDKHGKTRDFSQADLQQMVDNFKPESIAFLAGHPDRNNETEPAYGYGKEINLTEDGKLYLSGEKVNVDFAKSVLSGAYGRRSIGILHDADIGWYIDHVAFLGATKPALDLQPVGQYNFATPNDAPPTQFEFSIENQTASTLTRFMKSMRDFFIESLGAEKANQIVDRWDLAWLEEQNILDQAENDKRLGEFTKPKKEEPKMPTQAELDAAVEDARKKAEAAASAEFQKQLDDANTRATEAEKLAATAVQEKQKADYTKRKDECQKLVEQAVSAGHLVPAAAEGLAEFMASLHQEEPTEFEFSRGTGDQAESVKAKPFEFAKELIGKLGIKSPLGNGKPDLIDGGNSQEDLTALAMEYQKSQKEAGFTITFADAIEHVEQKQS